MGTPGRARAERPAAFGLCRAGAGLRGVGRSPGKLETSFGGVGNVGVPGDPGVEREGPPGRTAGGPTGRTATGAARRTAGGAAGRTAGGRSEERRVGKEGR